MNYNNNITNINLLIKIITFHLPVPQIKKKYTKSPALIERASAYPLDYFFSINICEKKINTIIF